ncbi:MULTISPECIES: universal stress protein [unclassified Halorhabdus]|uniref:universal stress protein n=1 Tax=unclassified Halorhabdus TaxID=2621901 RepID=UPI0023DA41F6|nr:MULTISPECIES: universal stress protein [unclassified Halorhabdus]WEL17889.1 Nucleotide-binding protein, UspA family [Halorhabdus sp. SVX81]WEL21770.1 Nucleotide-binding protein, UspA family [Halorhabdus sp. BNX81]
MGTQILIPTDGTDRTRGRVKRAFDLASREDAAVHALYVVDTQRYGEPALSSVEVLIECFEDTGRDHLCSLVEEGKRQGVTVEKHCRRGNPATEIAAAAEELSVDLVIPCLSAVTPAQLRRKGIAADRIADPRSPITA